MASTIAVATPYYVEFTGGEDTAITVEETLRRRNEELELELRRREETEEKMRIELEKMKWNLRMVEEAEERLCSELGELEAEFSIQARTYYDQIRSLMEELEQAKRLLHLSGSSFIPASI